MKLVLFAFTWLDLSACHTGLLADNRTPVGSVKFLSTSSPADLMPRSRMRPLNHLVPSDLPEPRCLQAPCVGRGFDLFGSAFFTRYFTPRTLQTSSGALSRSNTASLVQETLSSQLNIRSPFLLDQSLLKVPFLIGCTK